MVLSFSSSPSRHEDSSKWEWDFWSQLYYHATSGFYHNPVVGWSYSTREGLYYRFENGSYVLWDLTPTPTTSLKPVAQTPDQMPSPNPSPPLSVLGSNNLAHAITKPAVLDDTSASCFGLTVEDKSVVNANLPNKSAVLNLNTKWNLTQESRVDNKDSASHSNYSKDKIASTKFGIAGNVEYHNFGCSKSLAAKTNYVPLEMDGKDKANGAPRKYEWWPPWQPRETKLNAIGWREWRPPWCFHIALEDKVVLMRWGIDTYPFYVTSSS